MSRVLMIVDHAFPPDIRVENEAVALIEAGYEVTVLAIGPDSRPRVEVHRGIRIVRNRISAQRRNKMRGLAGSLPILDRYVARHAEALYREFPFDALHVHDLYLFGGGLRAGRALGVPVVGDLHENWVEALRGYAWSTRFPGRLFVNFDRWERVERLWTRSVDRLIVVVDEALERNRENGVDPDRMVVVSNTLNVDEFESHAIDEALVRSMRSPFHLLYVGGFDLHRGIDSVLDAMPAILDQVPDATLTLVGDGRIADDLKVQSRRLGIDKSVRFEGWQPHGRLKSYMLAADVCLVPHRRTPHTDATLPHKLFQYMYCAKPVVVSDCKPLERIVMQTESGLVFRGGDPASLAEAVIELANRTTIRSSMGTRGRDAVLQRFSWKVEAARLVQMYDGLLDPDRDLIKSRQP
ncbi:MAG: glycosyltransferase family 4 protein [Rhodothermia bacterium]|nr:glycosyltransferase family 4 protein [Rhodothermia bacterium]